MPARFTLRNIRAITYGKKLGRARSIARTLGVRYAAGYLRNAGVTLDAALIALRQNNHR